MSRVINFSAGPATLPVSVLEEIRDEMMDFKGSGMSLLEHSHRGAEYTEVHETATALVRELFAVPDTHEVLWLQGGASGQFAMVPMNFLGGGVADYVDTGSWSKKAQVAAGFYGKPRYAATGKEGERYVRAPQKLDLSADAKYVHLTSNATIAGVQYHSFPEVLSSGTAAPLVADMSSDMLWRPVDVSKFSLIYAGAQKNLGPAGVTLAIIEKSLMAKGNQELPEMLRYDFIASKGSTHNTPPVFAIYAVGKVLAWVKAQGGAAAMEKRNRAKAEMLYGTIDGNAEFFRCPIEKASRSVMNVVFNLPTPELEKAFLDEGKKNGLVNMKGHRSVGGIRISMYNAMDPENIQTLTAFMKDFAAKNG